MYCDDVFLMFDSPPPRDRLLDSLFDTLSRARFDRSGDTVYIQIMVMVMVGPQREQGWAS